MTIQALDRKKPETQQPLDSPPTFARFIGVTPQAVRNWVHDGKIPCIINTGRIIRFDRAAAIRALGGEGAAR